MSRASQAGLEVERYIGSYLISSTLRPTLQKTLVNNNTNNIINNNNNNNINNSISSNSNNCKKESVSLRNYQQNYSGSNEQCQYGTWTGAPLISMTSSPRRSNQRSSPSPCQQPIEQQSQSQTQSVQHQHLQNRSPLSRLAIHTQGAPLILAGRFHNRGKAGNVIGTPNVNNFCSNTNSSTNMSIGRCPPVRSIKNVEAPRKTQHMPGYQHQHQHQQVQVQVQQIQQQSHQQPINLKNDCHGKLESSGASIANIDSLSIASDESSNNCENSLPRIIKPRKRRKKDRKPANVVTTENSKPEDRELSVSINPGLMPNGINGDQSNLVTLKPYVPVCYEAMRYEVQQQQQQQVQQQNSVQHRAHRRPPVSRESYSGRTQTPIQQEIVDTRQSTRYAHRHAQVKVLDDNRNVVVPVLVRTTALAKGYRNHNHHPPANNNTNNSCNNNNSNCSNNNSSSNCNRLVHGNHGNGHHYIGGYDSCEKSGLVDDPGSCQCRYCNPSGLIWDVDQNGYSPFLTPPPSTNSNNEFVQFPQIPLFLSRSNLGCHQEEFFDVEDSLRVAHHHPHHHSIPVGATRHERLEPTGGALLRRSWSDPSSYFTEQICAPSRDVGVIGDRGQTAEAVARGRSSWPGSPSYVSLGTASGLSGSLPGNSVTGQSLEVSTEIVTSHNGHRDLEIKFFSSSPSSIQPEEDKSPFPEDNEDFSDIWSYHESKLQQDFRTLLQAEE